MISILSFLGCSALCLVMILLIQFLIKHNLLKILIIFRSGRFEKRRFWAWWLAFGGSAAGFGLGGLGLWGLIFGILGLFGGLFVSRFVLSWKQKSYFSQLDATSLAFFYSLSALLDTGLSLPEALFRSAQSDHGFSKKMNRQLHAYHQGSSLQNCLEQLKRYPMPAAQLFVQMVQLGYQKGLSVGILLQRLIPLLEADVDRSAKTSSLLRAAYGQALLVTLLPWSLFFFMTKFTPELETNFLHTKTALVMFSVVFVLQGMGAMVVHRVSKW